jgi:hypothetical protein
MFPPLRGKKLLVFTLCEKVVLLFCSREHLAFLNDTEKRVQLEEEINKVQFQNQLFKIEKSVLGSQLVEASNTEFLSRLNEV